MAKRTASAKKQARAGVRRAARNRAVKSSVKTQVAKARRSFTETPVAESDRHAITLEAVRSLDRAAAKGILHPNNVARRKARLARQLARVQVASAAAGAGAGASGERGGRRGAAKAPAAAAPASRSARKK